MVSLAIIDYGAGNLHSVCAGFRRVMQDGDTLEVVNTPESLDQFSHIVLPGVGAFGDCIAALKAADGMIAALEQQVLKGGKPFLGICVGMQMLFERGLEHGTHAGLGWFQGEVVALKPNDTILKIPHMGWNELSMTQPHPATEGINEGDHAYFVHSYHAQPRNPAEILATTAYGGNVVAMVGRGNIVGTQFHPEKSQHVGATVLANFLKMR
jgi:imidazole glycerol-phosphate synthase subunit HisH